MSFDPVGWMQENVLLLYATYFIVFVAIIGYFMFKNRGKILVRIKELPEKHVWVKPQVQSNEMFVMLRRGTKKEPAWKVTYDFGCLVPMRSWFRSYFALDVKPEASRACTWIKTGPDAEQPELTQRDVTRFAQAKIWEKRYAQEPREHQSALLYVILLVQIISVVVMFLIQTGRLRI